MRSIKEVLGGEQNPLFAGFGNKDTDTISYSVVGIKDNYNFTISSEGLIYMLKSRVNYTYPQLDNLKDQLFPEYNPDKLEDYEYSESNFWRRNLSFTKMNSEDIKKLLNN